MPRKSAPYRPAAPIVVELAAGAVVTGPGPGEPTILLLHHAEEDRWCLPKGHVEAGESLVDAALREVREETGLPDVRLGDEISEVSYRFFRPREQRNILKVTVYFLARTAMREAHPEPLFDRFEWARIPDAFQLLPFDTDRQVLEAAVTHLRDRS